MSAPPAPQDRVSTLTLEVNAFRESIGCGRLAWHGLLARVAQSHSEDMARRRFFGHVSPDGKSPEDRVRTAGIQVEGAVGENLASTTGGPQHVLRLWLESPSHRKNLEECEYTHHAIGLFNGMWTHLFVSNPGQA